MTIAVATQETTSQAVARPLKVLVPLIKQDIQEMQEITDRAVSPFYLSIGEKLLEAKEQGMHGYWKIWLRDNFKLSTRTAERYMNYASQTKNDTTVSHLSYAEHLHNKKQQAKLKPKTEQASAQNGTTTAQVESEAAKLEKEKLRGIASKIIDTGYKVLSKRMHPDVGGDAMDFNRLKTATTQLKELI
jgi:hypothetical protein